MGIGIEYIIGLRGKERLLIGCNSNEGIILTLEQWYQHLDFWSITTLGDTDDHVRRLYHS